MYNSLIIANYFINKSIKTGVELTPMKILKLVYISHGWYLGNYRQPLISEAVLAWKYGPVIREVYEAFKKYGKMQITSYADVILDGKITRGEVIPDDNHVKLFLDLVWDKYAHFNGLQLSSLTHRDGTPWDRTVKEKGYNTLIPRQYIEDYYTSRVETAHA